MSCVFYNTYSLEVIPGDAYRVERTGKDKAGGYVTKVVYNNNNNNKNTDGGMSAEEQEETTTTMTKKKNKGAGGCVDDNTKVDKKKERRKRQKEKKKQLKRKMSDDDDNIDTNDDDNDERDGLSSTSAASKTKRIKSSITTKEEETVSKNDPTDTELTTEEDHHHHNINNAEDTIDEAINNLRTSWSIHAPGIVLHSTLCAGLVKLGYDRPTPIQSSSLPAAMLGRRDIVGAAPTGSGKTLGYGLPILQYLLEVADGESMMENVNEEAEDNKRSLQALILVPTRELAMQVTSELTRVSCNRVKIGTIVGGFAEVKQRRTLEKGRPPILVATPGRLWELVSSSMSIFCINIANIYFRLLDVCVSQDRDGKWGGGK